MGGRGHIRSDQEMLDLLSALWRKKGYLSVQLMLSSQEGPRPASYVLRFGSDYAAYERIGYQRGSRYNFKKNRAQVETIINTVVYDIISNVQRLGGNGT